MNNSNQPWIFSLCACVLLTAVLGVQVVLPSCSLFALSFHRLHRLYEVESNQVERTSAVEIVTNEREIQWSIKDHECTWHGHSYDVVHVVRYKDTIQLVAVLDKEEDESKLSISTALLRELRSLRSINNVLAAFLLCPIHADNANLITVINISAVDTPSGSVADSMVVGWQGEVPTPPPWTWFRS